MLSNRLSTEARNDPEEPMGIDVVGRGVQGAVVGVCLLLAPGLVGPWSLAGQAPASDPAISATAAQAAIEGRQEDPGPQGFGDSTLAELMIEFGVPGASIAVIRDFGIHWAKGYGVADRVTGTRVHVETRFQAASISKPVAAMGVLRAVQDGLFGLDDDINDILRSWTLDGAGFTERRPVTPRSLTSHTSGLGDGFGFPGYAPDAPLPTTVEILDGAPASNVGRVFMEREPMEFFEYSGGGVTLMELALSDAVGRPFPDFMRERVLDPIGMTNSSFEQPMRPEHEPVAARGHDRDGEAMGPKWHVYPEHAAAGLWTTPTDLALFMIEVQKSARGESNRVLSRAMTHEMLDPVGVGPFAVGFTVAPEGEGWYFSHGGSNWGFRALVVAHEVKGYGFVMMTNGERGGRLIDEVKRRVQMVYGWDAIAAPVPRGFQGAGPIHPDADSR